MTRTTAFSVPPEAFKSVRTIYRACDKTLGIRIEQGDKNQMDSLPRRRYGPISAAFAIMIDRSDGY